MNARQLSRQLRTADDPWLRNRRGILGLSLTAAGSMALISLYQMGLIRRLPEPPLPGLDAEKVDASEEAYARLQCPDAVIGLASYAVTSLLAAAGPPNRSPWLPLATAGKIGMDSAQATKLTYDQWAKHRAFCSWCLLAAGATFAMVPLAVPEARVALRRLVGEK